MQNIPGTKFLTWTPKNTAKIDEGRLSLREIINSIDYGSTKFPSLAKTYSHRFDDVAVEARIADVVDKPMTVNDQYNVENFREMYHNEIRIRRIIDQFFEIFRRWEGLEYFDN